ncbi:hypothetical protein AO501_25735 [Mycobacterium gordonae]|uniref:SCP domain-containing protein n=1 Tax=Mycobacterium gordonae TaxID=1778 RepID=A0A0Q2XB85_MYCGO|nr:hypothetical protein AO501_25735 [Mycobacterium gordonae]
MRRLMLTLSALPLAAVAGVPCAHADNKRLNDSLVANVFTVQHQAGCTNDVRINPQLQLAAQWHTLDVLNNRNLNGDIGTDGSAPQDRAAAAGYRGKVAETVAINPAVSISGVELINQWYYEPAYFAIMSNCANSQIGVWSENSPDRTVVVAVYGQPDGAAVPPSRPSSVVPVQENVPLDPRPDYDATDEIEYAVDWFPWILRGVNPPPGIPPE